MFKILLPVCLLASLAFAHHESVNSKQQTLVKRLYDSIVTPEYNSNLRPYGVNGTDATFVTLQLRDVNVLNVDTTKGTFTFQGYFRREWVDSRLAYNDTSVSYIRVKDCKTLWNPDTYFYNGVEIDTYPYVYHTPAELTKIFPQGNVFQSFRHTQSIHCPYIYRPEMKEFVCSVRFGSYGYFSDELQVNFPTGGDGGVSYVRDGFLPNFTFGGVTATACDSGKARLDDGTDHKHSCVQVDFRFTRN